jgi:hypothetical protein
MGSKITIHQLALVPVFVPVFVPVCCLATLKHKIKQNKKGFWVVGFSNYQISGKKLWFIFQ